MYVAREEEGASWSGGLWVMDRDSAGIQVPRLGEDTLLYSYKGHASREERRREGEGEKEGWEEGEEESLLLANDSSTSAQSNG